MIWVGSVFGQVSGDEWLGPEGKYPPFLTAVSPDEEVFAELRADFVAGQLKIIWPGGDFPESQLVDLVLSEDEPGHWRARDWRRLPMTRRSGVWECRLPVVDLDVPFVYFVSIAETLDPSSPANREEAPPVGRAAFGERSVLCSPLRICRPRLMGMEEATRSFFPFLEGFEEEVWNWRVEGVDGADAGLQTVAWGHTGQRALAVTIPPGHHSIRLLTSRVRGWQALRQGASGLRLWLRSPEGPAQVRFVLLSNTGSSNEVAQVHPQTLQLDSEWQDVNLPFGDFDQVPLVSVDALALEIWTKEPGTVLIDDLQLLGPWRLVD